MSAQEFLASLQERATRRHARVALPDAEDERCLKAASVLASRGIAQPVLVGKEALIRAQADRLLVDLRGVEVVSTDDASQLVRYTEVYAEKRRDKNPSPEAVREAVMNPLICGGLLLDTGMVDCCVAGSVSSTRDVLRAALQTISLAPGVSTLSSFFLMVLEGAVYSYADCAVVPYPTATQLVDIARSASLNFERLVGQLPRIAFLSFSTKGSAEHESVTKVRDAVQLFKKRYPDVAADGELQADAALVPTIAQRKAPDSPLRGNANVLVFPNLDAGNICYKITERLAGATALGPIVQGLSKPYCDLSRGCSVEDIVNTVSIAALMSQTRDDDAPIV